MLEDKSSIRGDIVQNSGKEIKRIYWRGVFEELEAAIMSYFNRKYKEHGCGYGFRKKSIQEDTQIPMMILSPLLKELRNKQKIELIMICSEETGMPNGSGYALKKQEKPQ